MHVYRTVTGSIYITHLRWDLVCCVSHRQQNRLTYGYDVRLQYSCWIIACTQSNMFSRNIQPGTWQRLPIALCNKSRHVVSKVGRKWFIRVTTCLEHSHVCIEWNRYQRRIKMLLLAAGRLKVCWSQEGRHHTGRSVWAWTGPPECEPSWPCRGMRCVWLYSFSWSVCVLSRVCQVCACMYLGA